MGWFRGRVDDAGRGAGGGCDWGRAGMWEVNGGKVEQQRCLVLDIRVVKEVTGYMSKRVCEKC